MKKNLDSLVSRMASTGENKLSGGFAAIKGGGPSFIVAYNNTCTNDFKCSGTNVTTCTNNGDCSWTTNQSGDCSNNNSCRMA